MVARHHTRSRLDGFSLALYLKKFHADDPLFQDSKVITSVYPYEYSETFSDKLYSGLEFDGIEGEDLAHFKSAETETLSEAGFVTAMP